MAEKAQTQVKPTAVPVGPAAGGSLQRQCACGTHTLGDQCDSCKGKSGMLQRQASSSAGVSEVPPVVHEVLSSPGQSLDLPTREFMESRFGHDFSHVRIHTDGKAARSTRAVDALAYTVGKDVVFGAGQYAPSTNAGRQMLAHELTHVVQQRNAPSFGALQVGASDLPGEREADAVASRVMIGLPVEVRQQSVALQRYGHDHSCKTDAHLKPFVWPGHDHAKKVTQRALDETGRSTLHRGVAGYLTSLFGKTATEPETVKTIHQNFGKIQTALNEQYLYHCVKNKQDVDEDEAVTCNVQNAQTNRSGRKDITLCFDQLKDWSVPAAAWVIVHENVHRGLNAWGHDWEAGKVDKCILSPPAPNNLQLKNPDAYACFAVLMWDLG